MAISTTKAATSAPAGLFVRPSDGDAVQLISVSKSYGRHRHRIEALQDVTTSFPPGNAWGLTSQRGCT